MKVLFMICIQKCFVIAIFFRYDLFLAFAINTFYWIYLRIKGIDPNNHEIKHQIDKVRDYMIKSKKIYEKKTIMPKIDQVSQCF